MEISEKFNQVAGEYDRNRRRFIPHFDQFYSETTDFLLRYIPEPHCIADLGAGTGLLAHLWFQRCPDAQYILVDVAEDMLNIARERFAGAENVSFLLENYVEKLPSASFDTVISALSIHHLKDTEKEQLFREIHKRLPENGIFVNYDQFRAADPVTETWMEASWQRFMKDSGLTEKDLALARERRLLDNECTVGEEMAMLRKGGFREPVCIYSWQKFSVLTARKQVV